MNLLLEAMVKKLSYTASLELVPLMEVPGVKQVSQTCKHSHSLPNRIKIRVAVFCQGGRRYERHVRNLPLQKLRED